ncbi:MAG: hypothetical protein HKO63_10815 [Acidimicrobiia bacterium]|nr:Jag N-terminal domain-containing protein [Acidimicrobiia bacterium]MBT8193417.1 Jag N-terminal domain-containing protein [Acidimicrobiia bacterium]MBT8248577.1 Jag N-terminal domain-containing protein [Acidimicrobiia bacterium]NNF87739.1 hypothetical protein [Acidimicrobiia bacterium]NNJ47240.1 hypothetical protein [Acidimicrobiia bacterium]
MEWVEVRGRTVEAAVEAALAELGLASADEANIEVVEEPNRGFLGMGSREALVRVTPKPKQEKRQRRRKRGGGGSEKGRQQKGRPEAKGRDDRSGRQKNQSRQGGRSSGGRDERSGRQNDQSRQAAQGGRGGRNEKTSKQTRKGQDSPRAKERTMEEPTTPEVEIDAEGQAAVVAEFLEGLLNSFGLEGDVTTSVEDELIIADVAGEQTEALIGPKGSIMQSVGELTRTVVQRKTHRRARLRLDVGGYQERRREALRIYTARLAEQVLEDGGEIMLEPMNPADRKTVHDAVVDIEGVSSFSEGEEPNRSVVIALAPGVEPRGASEGAPSEDAGEGDPDEATDTDIREEGADADAEGTDDDSSDEAGDSEDE